MSDSLFYRVDGDRAVIEQYFDTFRRAEYLEPEKVLLLAVLQDAIHCYRKFSAARDWPAVIDFARKGSGGG